MQRKHLIIGALVALPLLVGGGAAAFAASGSTGTSPAQAFIADLASHLGISTSTLQSAMQQTELDQVQKMVDSGKITQAQATKIEAAIKAGKVGPGLGMGVGMRGRRGGPMGMLGGRQAMQAAATYLNVTQQQLMTDLQGGKTLSDIASSTQNKTVQGLEAAITTAIQQNLQQAVTNGKMTQTQEQQAESNLQQFVQKFVTSTGHGPRGGHGWGGPAAGQQGSGSGSQTTPTN